MHERILVIDKQDLPTQSDLGGSAALKLGIGLAGLADGGNQGRCLQFGFGFFFLGDGIKQQCRAGAHFRHAVLDADRTQRQTGIHVAVEADHANRAAIPDPWAALVLLDKAHGPKLWRAGHGNRPGMAQKGVKRIHVRAQAALDVVHRVDEARIHLDLPPTDDPDRTRLADAALVVAVDIRAHRQFGFVLLGIEQLEDLLAVLDGILPALDRA